jgi:putative hydrolase of HD superfamily
MTEGATVNAVVRLGELSLAFGRVPRITFHPDGKRSESDTDHTVMLVLTACSLARKWYPHLDVGLIAQFGSIHDVHEVYAGDTPTLVELTEAERAAKKAREREAQIRIDVEFRQELPWLPATIADYEAGVDPEARLVRYVDKFLPKITHLLNGAATIAEQGMTRDELAARYESQARELARYAAEFPEVALLRQALIDRLLEQMDRRHADMAAAELSTPTEPELVAWDDLTPGVVVRYYHHSRARRLAGRSMLIRRARIDQVYPTINYGRGQINLTVLNKDGSPNRSLQHRVYVTRDQIVSVEAASRD